MRRSLLVSLAAVALASTACVSSDDPGVRASSFQTDIVFDAAKAEVGPVTTSDIPTQAGTAPLFPEPFRNKIPERFNDVRFTLTPEQAASDCPAAPIGAAPTTAAPEKATAPPKAGLYRYKLSGTRKQVLDGNEYVTSYSGFEPHVIRDVEQSSDTLWTFKEITPTADGVQVISWMTNTDPTEVRNPTTGGRGVSTPYVGENAYRAGEPGRGVAIVSIEVYDGNGNQVQSFQPTTPILLLPLPVVQGESWTATGVDTKSGQSMRVDGEVEKRQTVDACGTLVDGWLVSATVTESQDGAAVSQEREYIFSTERGGLPIESHIVFANEELSIDFRSAIGQVEPSADEAAQ